MQQEQQEPTREELLQHAKTHIPMPGVDYDWVMEQALKELGYAREAIERLHARAHNVIGYVGAIGGLSAVIAIRDMAQVSLVDALSFAPALTAAIGSAVLAVTVLSPRPGEYPPITKVALEYAQAYGKEAKARFALTVGVAARGQRDVAAQKGKFLREALCFVAVAMALLLLPCIALWLR